MFLTLLRFAFLPGSSRERWSIRRGWRLRRSGRKDRACCGHVQEEQYAREHVEGFRHSFDGAIRCSSFRCLQGQSTPFHPRFTFLVRCTESSLSSSISQSSLNSIAIARIRNFTNLAFQLESKTRASNAMTPLRLEVSSVLLPLPLILALTFCPLSFCHSSRSSSIRVSPRLSLLPRQPGLTLLFSCPFHSGGGEAEGSVEDFFLSH